MTAIRATLQREVFSPDDERLIAVVSVVKSNSKKKKKGKTTFLCLTGECATLPVVFPCPVE